MQVTRIFPLFFCVFLLTDILIWRVCVQMSLGQACQNCWCLWAVVNREIWWWIAQLKIKQKGMILMWFKNGCHCRPMPNSLIGHHEHLIWTPSRICGVRWRGQCRKHSLASLPEAVMPCVLLYQTFVTKLLCLSVTFVHWVGSCRDKWNQCLKHRGCGLLIKGGSSWKQLF